MSVLANMANNRPFKVPTVASVTGDIKGRDASVNTITKQIVSQSILKYYATLVTGIHLSIRDIVKHFSLSIELDVFFAAVFTSR